MTDRKKTPGKRIFRSKERRQRGRQRMHKRIVFDAAKRAEIELRCLDLRKAIKPAPSPQYKPLPTVERLNELLVVNFEIGSVRVRVTRSQLREGDLLGKNASGYVQANIDGVAYKLHRLIWKMKYGRDPTGQIDHIDGNPSNNATSNLRDVLPSENCRNRSQQPSNSSGRLGVSKCRTTGLWVADIGWNYKTVHLGKYKRRECAIAARECAELHLFGAVSQNRKAAKMTNRPTSTELADAWPPNARVVASQGMHEHRP